MKVKVLFFDDDASDPYFHLCVYIYESKVKGKMRWFRKIMSGQKEGWLSILKDGLRDPHNHTIIDSELFNYLMDKFGTLEGTYAEWEL